MTPEEQARKLIEPYRGIRWDETVECVSSRDILPILSDKIKRIAELEKQMEEIRGKIKESLRTIVGVEAERILNSLLKLLPKERSKG